MKAFLKTSVICMLLISVAVVCVSTIPMCEQLRPGCLVSSPWVRIAVGVILTLAAFIGFIAVRGMYEATCDGLRSFSRWYLGIQS